LTFKALLPIKEKSSENAKDESNAGMIINFTIHFLDIDLLETGKKRGTKKTSTPT